MVDMPKPNQTKSLVKIINDYDEHNQASRNDLLYLIWIFQLFQLSPLLYNIDYSQFL